MYSGSSDGSCGPGGSRGSFGSFRSCGSSGFDDPKGISIGSMDLNDPKVYGDTSIFDSRVYC